MLNEYKLKAICDVVKYYVETTGNDCNAFIETLRLVNMGQVDNSEYAQWLVQECFKVLVNRGVSVADIMTQRKMLQSLTTGTGTTSENDIVWYSVGTEYLVSVLGDKMNTATIWCATAGLGDLVAGPTVANKVFLSALNKDDIKYSSTYTNAECFDIDFLALDTTFIEKLPLTLRDALLCNKEVVLLAQLPDRVVKAGVSEIGTKMLNDGYSLCANDVSMQFIYRLLLLKEQYNLSNLTIGLYSSDILFSCRAAQSLYSTFLCNFEYKKGMCFNIDGSRPKGDIHSIYFTVWRSYDNVLPFEPTVSMALDVKEKINGLVQTTGVLNLSGAAAVQSLEEWVAPKDAVNYKTVPLFTTYSEARTVGKIPENAMGSFVSKYYDTDGTSKCRVYNGAAQGGIAITEENFDRVVAAFAARRLIDCDVTAMGMTEHFMSPDVTIEGYNDWVARCIPLFLFDTENYVCSYRNFECANKTYNISNSFNPISSEYLSDSDLVSDKVLLADISANPQKNKFVLNKLKAAKPLFDEATSEFYNFCIAVLCDTYYEDNRLTANYPNWTNAWDASLTQIRLTNNSLLWPKTQADKYAYLLSKYKKSIEYGVYKYGFR